MARRRSSKRGQGGQDRRPVVAKLRKMRTKPIVQALNYGYPRLEMGIGAYRFVEDHQAIGGGLERVETK